MKKIHVGKDFKIPMFGFKGECIHDKNTGYLFFDDDEIVNRLKLNEDEIIHLQIEDRRSLLKKDDNDKRLLELEMKMSDQEKEFRNLKDLVEDKSKQVSAFDKKIDVARKEILQMKNTLKAISEMSEGTIKEQQQVFNIIETDTTLKEIWNNHTNKNSAALFCIMIMIKKYLEDKGTRIE